MLQFQLMTDKDRKEAAVIERRRAIEEERKKRIFNARQRLIGCDIKALDAQIEEKKKLDSEQKKVEQIFAEQLKKNDQIAVALGQKETEERKQLAREINQFRDNYQKFQDRREFDLNDPDERKKMLPARIHDDDPRLGISSFQKFEGEDLAGKERKVIQREQIKSWLQQQVEERTAVNKERKMADDAYKAAVIARDERAIQLDKMEKDCRKHLERACSRFNQALATEHECDKKERDKQEFEDNMAQMYNIMTSDMMTENPDVSLSNMGANRRIGYLYKGMSPEEKMEYKKDQIAQLEEAKVSTYVEKTVKLLLDKLQICIEKKAEEKRFEREWEDYSNGIQRSIAVMDLELARKQRERNKALAEENKRLAIEHKNHQEYMNKIVYSNKPTAAFYDQFNKSSR